jgi:transposase
VLQITPQMRVLVALEAVDGRKGIDSLVQLWREKLAADPFSGCVFVFRSRSSTSIRLLAYDGQGFWLAQKRLSKGRFMWWPDGKEAACSIEAYQASCWWLRAIQTRRPRRCGGVSANNKVRANRVPIHHGPRPLVRKWSSRKRLCQR